VKTARLRPRSSKDRIRKRILIPTVSTTRWNNIDVQLQTNYHPEQAKLNNMSLNENQGHRALSECEFV
jgi:hypothetical protein